MEVSGLSQFTIGSVTKYLNVRERRSKKEARRKMRGEKSRW